MRRTVALVGLWLAGAALAVFVAWQGVGVVGDQVTDERPAPLAASEIERRLADTTTTANASLPSPPATTTTPEPTPAERPPTTTPGPAAPPPAATSPPPSDPSETAETRTYNLRGGTAALRFTRAGVEVVFANPAPGFSVGVEREHGTGVKVTFESDAHESRVDGWWDAGPVDRVREDPES